MHSIGVTLVAGRRPDLLQRTLDSFHENFLGSVDVSRVRVNIDPIFGNLEDGRATHAIVERFFPKAEVRKAQEPGFGAAVKWLWSGVEDGIFLHMEDDWLLLDKVDPKAIFASIRSDVRAATLLSETHGKRGRSEYSELVPERTGFIKSLFHKRTPLFGTCPGFFDGEFGRTVARLMAPNLDPEKQMRRPMNPELNDYIERYRCKFVKSREGGPIIQVIGREWRDQRKISKVLIEGTSHWITKWQASRSISGATGRTGRGCSKLATCGAEATARCSGAGQRP